MLKRLGIFRADKVRGGCGKNMLRIIAGTVLSSILVIGLTMKGQADDERGIRFCR
jgi:hypothetical protein